MSPELQQLLLKYHGVFEFPSGLPPSRAYDHSIPLLLEATLVKIKPYKYPHSQNTKIENMAKDMLRELNPVFIYCFIGEKEGWFLEVLY